MRFILMPLGLFLALGGAGLPSQAANRCEAIFLEGPYHPTALSLALTRAHSSKKNPGLSRDDLKFLVEGVLNRQEGRRYLVSEYWKKNAYERTLKVLERQVAEEITQRGLLHFFEQQGLLLNKSRLRTQLELVNQSPTFNILSGLWAAITTLKGIPPLLLPEGEFKLKPEDFNLLLLKGVESPEGRALVLKYQMPMEFNRGYDLFSRYYSRVALAVLLYVVYDNVHNTNFEQIMAQVEKAFGPDETFRTKEDILLATVLRNFKNEYSRLPDESELGQICFKIYGTAACPK